MINHSKAESSSPVLLSIAEFARLAGVSPMVVYRRTEAGEWPVVRIGSRRLIPAKFLDDLIAAAYAKPGTK